MDEYDSDSQLLYNGFEFNFVQVVNVSFGQELRPQIKLDGAVYTVFGYQKFRRAKENPFSRLELIPNAGRIVVIAGQSFEDADVSQGSGALLGGGSNTATNEVDSGPLNVPAGAAPVQIILANGARSRGVSVQNIGLTAIALAKTAALVQAGLANAAFILNAGGAANDGNGGSVVFDGWLGEIWAVNVAGGPGTLLVSAF